MASAEFDEPWPQVLGEMLRWLRARKQGAGPARGYRIVLHLSRASLLEAKSRGQALHPLLGQFRQTVVQEFGLPAQVHLRDSGPHQLQLTLIDDRR